MWIRPAAKMRALLPEAVAGTPGQWLATLLQSSHRPAVKWEWEQWRKKFMQLNVLNLKDRYCDFYILWMLECHPFHRKMFWKFPFLYQTSKSSHFCNAYFHEVISASMTLIPLICWYLLNVFLVAKHSWKLLIQRVACLGTSDILNLTSSKRDPGSPAQPVSFFLGLSTSENGSLNGKLLKRGIWESSRYLSLPPHILSTINES